MAVEKDAFTLNAEKSFIEYLKDGFKVEFNLDYVLIKEKDEPVVINDLFETKFDLSVPNQGMNDYLDHLALLVVRYRNIYVFSPSTQKFFIIKFDVKIFKYSIRTYFSFIVDPACFIG